MIRPLKKLIEKAIEGQVRDHLSVFGYSDEQIDRLLPGAMAAAPTGGILQWLLDHSGQIIQLVLKILALFSQTEAPANKIAA